MSNNFRSLSLNKRKVEFPIAMTEMSVRAAGMEHTEQEVLVIVCSF